jgi:hypothetical protein
MATEIRPMNTSELLDRIFFYYRNYFLLFIGIAAIPQLATLLVHLGFIGLQSPKTIILTTLVSLAVQIVANSIAQAATIGAISDIHLGRVASLRTSFTGVRGNLIEIWLIMLFAGIGVFIGFILLIVPGFILLAAWSLSIPAVVIENKTPIEAMKRSYSLTRGRRFQIFAILLLVALIVYIISLVINFPTAILTVILSLRNHGSVPISLNIVSVIASYISSCLATPISTIAISMIYYDQRVRKEGFDLQFMMSSLKSEPIATTEPANS